MQYLIIDCISDTHSRHKKINLPGGDIVIHAGDCSCSGELEEVLEFLDWFKEQKYSHRLLIAGNHDFIFELIPEQMEEECKKRNITLLNDSGCEIEGIKIWGSPIQPWFCDYAFNRHRGSDIKKHWDLIPADTEILITHGPPHGIRDEVMKCTHVGCEDLLNKIMQTRVKLHVFGHIHEAAGYITLDNRIYINACSSVESDSSKGARYFRTIKQNSRYEVTQLG
jgi:Icc-related predicted phosphoesterase